MSRFDHLLQTPFNLRTLGAPGLDPHWLERRFRLFESFCYPSVCGQTCRGFKWLVYLDTETPEEFKRRIEGLGRDGSLIPIYIRNIGDFLPPTLEHVDRRASHLISTTLDNDDALAIDFVERVQAEFREQEFELVNFPSGLRMDLLSGKLYAHRVRANPFLSLVERNESPGTIRGCGPHNLIPSRFGEIRDVESEPLWLQVVHGGNIAVTGVWGCRRVPLSELHGRFVLHTDAARHGENAWGIRLENARRSVERAAIGFGGRRGTAAATRLLKALRRLRAAGR